MLTLANFLARHYPTTWNCTLRETNDETIVGDYNVAVVDADRKVTCIAYLSDYEGGVYQIREISEDIIFDRRLLFGEYIIFPYSLSCNTRYRW